jgi:hypothetical protein
LEKVMLVPSGASFGVWLLAIVAAPPTGETIAIEKAKVGSGASAQENVTVVLRDGRILAIGRDVAIPPGAERIDATGLTLLPGFIDGFSDFGLARPDERGAGGGSGGGGGGGFGGGGANPGTASSTNEGIAQDYGIAAYAETAEASRRGLRPEVRARDLLGPPDKDAGEKLRSAGFTAVLSGPLEGLIPGQPCLLEVADLPARDAVVTEPGILLLKFRSGGDRPANVDGPRRGRREDGDFGYPSTLMGALAHLRQGFLDAQRLRSWRESYRRNPASVPRPPSDSCLDALLRALDGELRVAFLVDRESDILRALKLGEEFRLKTLIVGGKEAWKCAKQLAEARVPVVASLNFPDAPERKGAKLAKAAAPNAAPGAPQNAGETTPPKDANAAPPKDASAPPQKDAAVAPSPAAAPDAATPPANAVAATPPAGENAPVAAVPQNAPAKQEAPAPANPPAPTPGAAPANQAAPASEPLRSGPSVAESQWEIADPVLAEPLELFEQRKQDWNDEVSNVQKLLATGVTVALTTRGSNGTGDFFADLRVALEHGLSADAAITALTTTPAMLFGVDQELGSLRPGAAANLLLVEGDLGSKERAVRHVFVAGRHFLGAKKKPAEEEKGEGRGEGRRGRRRGEESPPGDKPPAEKALDLTGSWTITSTSGHGFTSTLTLKQDGTKLTGTLESEHGSADVTSGSLEGNEFTIKASFQLQSRTIEFTLKGTASKDSLEGTFETPFGEPSPFQGRRGPGAIQEEGR